MLIWKNTTILDTCSEGLIFTDSKDDAKIALMGSQPIQINDFPNLRAIFRAGIGQDNVPGKEAKEKSIVIRFPARETIDIIFDETATFTCGLIFRMLYNNLGSLDSWVKEPRRQMKRQKLLVMGTGQIGSRVAKLMKPFINILTYDVIQNKESELKLMIQQSDCITIHIPKSDNNLSFIDREKLSWMKSGSILINTARGAIIDEDALYEELKNDRLKAAFDVYWQEPYMGKLKELSPQQFFMTPHVASTCEEFLQGCRNDLNILIQELSS